MAEEDIRVLIPRVRRAVEGIGAPEVLTDDQIKDLIADSISNILLFTGGVFGKDLIVTERDATTNVPTEYATSEPLTLPEGSVVSYEAAITDAYSKVAELKTSETIRDEGQEWAYQLSANLIRDHLNYLIAQRNKALEEVGQMPTAFYSFLHERDLLIANAVEPYVLGYSGSGGQELVP
jgi:hypothetical protein